MVWPVGEALVVDSAPREKRSRAISIYIFLTNIGIVAGPIIGGGILYFSEKVLNLSELTSIKTPFYFTSAIAFIGAFIGLFFLRDMLPPIKDKKKMVLEEKKAIKLLRPIIRRSLYMLYANSFFEGISWSLGSVVMFFFMQRNYGMSAMVFSVLFGVAQGLGLILVVPSGVLSDRTKKKPFIVWGSIGSRISTIIMSFTPSFPFGKWLAMIFYSGKDMGRQVAMPATRSLQADLVPEKIRGKLIGTIQAWSNIGAVLGPIVGGFIWDITNGRVYDIMIMDLPGDTIAFLLSAFMGIIAALLVQRYVFEPPKGETIG
jgi:MFS family permease